MIRSRRTGNWNLALYSVAMLLIFIGTVGYLLYLLYNSTSFFPVKETKLIYVPIEQNSSESSMPESKQSPQWIVREYEGKIGIFLTDGTLTAVLDTYVKTLPKADQMLLGEGIVVYTQSELNAVVEDYSD